MREVPTQIKCNIVTYELGKLEYSMLFIPIGYSHKSVKSIWEHFESGEWIEICSKDWIILAFTNPWYITLPSNYIEVTLTNFQYHLSLVLVTSFGNDLTYLREGGRWERVDLPICPMPCMQLTTYGDVLSQGFFLV